MFYLFHWFRSFLPLHNPIGFGASDFIELAFAAALVSAAFAWGWWKDAARRFAERTGWCMIALFAAPIVLRVALLPLHPIPTPLGSDDFSYLLLGDTLAHFRLANPVHPMHRFFESVFILQEPSYSSIYPFGPALAHRARRDWFSEARGRASRFRSACFARCAIGCCAAGPLRVVARGRRARGDRVRSAEPVDEQLLGRRRIGHRRVHDFRRCAAPAEHLANAAPSCSGLGIGLEFLARPYESVFLSTALMLFFVPAVFDAGARRRVPIAASGRDRERAAGDRADAAR